MLLMEHNQNQQKLEFLWNTKDWPCTCFPVVDHSPTAVMIPMTLHDGHHLFRRRNGPKNVDFNSEHWLETPQKRVISPNQVGDLRLTDEVVAIYVAIIFPHPKQLFSKKSQDLFHLPFFTMAFLGFPMIFLRSTMVFQWVSNQRPGRCRKRGRLREASHATTGHVLGLGDAAAPPWGLDGKTLRWMVVFYGFSVPKTIASCWTTMG